MADDKTKKAEDLELSEDKAGEVKGGRLPGDGGGTSTRGVAAHTRRGKKGGAAKPLHGSMGHE